MKINDAEFKKRERDYLYERGPNPGDGFMGKLAWWVKQRRAFRDQLRSEGYDIPEEIVPEWMKG